LRLIFSLQLAVIYNVRDLQSSNMVAIKVGIEKHSKIVN